MELSIKGHLPDNIITTKEKIYSRSLAERVVFQLGLSEKPEFLFPKPDFSLFNIVYRAFGLERGGSIERYTPEQRQNIAIGRVLGGISVSLVPETSLLRLSYSNQSPGFAADVANQIAESFIDQRVDQTSETSDLARQFIQEQNTTMSHGNLTGFYCISPSNNSNVASGVVRGAERT